ncbi:MAG: HAD family hydrolase [Acidobacteriota bacterium]|nr:HAD family hydrolase [Acidobacteriota bacterium]
MIAAVGFDLDFTLYDQADFVLPFFRRVAPKLAAIANVSPAVVYDVFTAVWSEKTPRYGKLFDEALQILNVHNVDLVAQLVNEHRSWRPPLDLYPGVRSTLERLSARFPLILITDGHATVQRYKVEALEIAPLFAATVYTDEFGAAWQKPSPQPFLYAADLVGARARDCVFVGDNPHADLEGARRSGMLGVRVLTGPYSRGGFSAAAEVTVSSASKLEEILGVLN